MLYTHPAVAEVAVIGTPDEKWIEAITAVVVPKPGQQVTQEELIALVKGRLAPFKGAEVRCASSTNYPQPERQVAQAGAA